MNLNYNLCKIKFLSSRERESGREREGERD